MKKFITLATVMFLSIGTAGKIQAQHSHQTLSDATESSQEATDEPRMMHGQMEGMSDRMSGMMDNPVHESVANIFGMLALEEALELEAEQLDELIILKNSLLERVATAAENLASENRSFAEFLYGNTFSPEGIEGRLVNTARLIAQRVSDVFNTEVTMKTLLTQEQTEKFDRLERRDMHNRMMSRMSMDELKQMMDIMSCDMMSGSSKCVVVDESTHNALMGMMPRVVTRKGADMGSMDNCPMHAMTPPDENMHDNHQR